MRTLSARILLGFAALTVVFGAITATVVVNMRIVEQQVHRVRSGYVPLALVSKDLARREEDLKAYLEEGWRSELQPSVQSARINLTRVKNRRDIALAAIRKNLESLDQLGDFDSQSFPHTRHELDQLQASIDAMKPAYDRVLRAPPNQAESLDDPQLAAALDQLRAGEHTVWTEANELAADQENRVRATTINLEENEHKLFLVTIYCGLIAMVLGSLITIWVVVTLRPLRRLRDAARKVASGDYGSRIVEKGPAEVKDLARELNSMARAVEERERELVRSERLAAVGKMAAMITHEVRNPLSSIGLNTELLEDELEGGSGEARELCRAIHREVDRLTAITDEYLSFSRLPKPKLAYEPVNAMVGALASFVREDLAKKHVELAVELGAGDPVALIDAAQIRQCLINLVRNASEAVVAKGKGTVTLRAKQDADRVVIEVEDDGVGIAPDVLPRLFDPFFSTKEGGSGLGLALTQQIVKDHGGDLSVDSVVGRGTTFKLTVPARA